MPSIAIAKPYEAIYILDPDSGEEQVSAVTSRYKSLVETSGGTVEKVDIWERRKLAYAIKGRTEGIYVVMNFTGEPKVEAELRRVFQISEDQLRAMIVKPEEGMDAEPSAALPSAPPFQAAPSIPAPQPVAVSESAPAMAESAPAPEAADAPAQAADAPAAETAELAPVA